ncbi:MAG: hypothetical protein K0R72_157 [Clostridia bacterium]|jgi:hypothetical protein|nr:hypothetical protein [Clostridia bacterium]
MGNENGTNEVIPEPISSTLYIAGYLKTQIGKLVKVEFLIGGSTTDRIGVLVSVGVSYIILRPIDVNGLLLCDLYSIKFVTIVERPNIPMFGGFGNM